MAFASTLTLALLLAAEPSAAPSPEPTLDSPTAQSVTSTPAPSPTPTPPVLAPSQAPCVGPDGKPLPEAMMPVLIGSKDLTPPRIRKKRNPVFPLLMGGCRIPPKVVVEAIITTKGDICGARIASELPPQCAAYGKAWLNAVKQWKFHPARMGEEPVAVFFVTTGTYQRERW
jgi:hypothetical protein